MAFARPTLAQLVSRICGDIQTKLTISDAYLRNSVERVIGVALAGAAHMLHGHLVWLSRQLFPDKAEAEFLARWASIYQMTRKAASSATGMLPITGAGGSVCPMGTIWQRNDGVRYTQDADATIVGGAATVALTAEAPGSSGNAEIGTKLSLVAPVAGITSEATLIAAISGGADVETDEELRVRLLQRLREPPSGGGPGDYVRWAREVAGVTRAWQFARLYGNGTVGVTFLRDNDLSIIPDAGEVAAVAAHIATVAPVDAGITVFAPTSAALDMTIQLSPNTAATRAAVEAELDAMFLRDANPSGITIYRSRIIEAISRAAGEEHHALTVPAADVVYALGQMPVKGVITWL